MKKSDKETTDKETKKMNAGKNRIRIFLRRHWWAVVYSLFLAAFTIYLAMDTFVVSRVYTVVTETENAADRIAAVRSDMQQSAVQQPDIGQSSDSQQKNGENSEHKHRQPGKNAEGKRDAGEERSADSEAVMTESSFSDEAITITVKEYREYETSIYVADVVLSSPEYLRTAFAQNAYGRNVTEKTSEIAENAGAILAINGDFYGAQNAGYVLRNGILYRSKAVSGREDLAIYEDGRFGIVKEAEITAEELLADGVRQILSFGPVLVKDGAIAVSETDEVGKAKASNPRTAIGVVEDLHYVFVVSDGRTEESAGLSLSQLAEFMTTLGVEIAYNLDGGGSSTMYFNGEVINHPTTNGKSIKERSVSDIVYIG